MEEKEVNDIILELKTSLEKKYGTRFFKFYLCELNNGSWEGLISTKEEDGTRKGSYYRIKDNEVDEEIL